MRDVFLRRLAYRLAGSDQLMALQVLAPTRDDIHPGGVANRRHERSPVDLGLPIEDEVVSVSLEASGYLGIPCLLLLGRFERFGSAVLAAPPLDQMRTGPVGTVDLGDPANDGCVVGIFASARLDL